MAQKRTPLPAQDVLLALYAYDPATGVVSWKSTGRPVNMRISNGYWNVSFGDIKRPATLVIWKMVHGVDAEAVWLVDNNANNLRLANLRGGTRREAGDYIGRMQAMELLPPRVRAHRNHGPAEGVPRGDDYGLHYDASRQRWVVEIYHEGHSIRIGRRRTESAARALRDEAMTHPSDFMHKARKRDSVKHNARKREMRKAMNGGA